MVTVGGVEWIVVRKLNEEVQQLLRLWCQHKAGLIEVAIFNMQVHVRIRIPLDSGDILHESALQSIRRECFLGSGHTSDKSILYRQPGLELDPCGFLVTREAICLPTQRYLIFHGFYRQFVFDTQGARPGLRTCYAIYCFKLMSSWCLTPVSANKLVVQGGVPCTVPFQLSLQLPFSLSSKSSLNRHSTASHYLKLTVVISSLHLPCTLDDMSQWCGF